MPRALVESLSEPAAYPFPVGKVEVRHTHISVVFLAGPYAYKIKKPLDLGFLDFTTLEKRRQACLAEVRLNRRLAPAVYLEVVPVTQTVRGMKIEAEGEPVEWAVKMKRLPDEATLRQYLLRADIRGDTVQTLAHRLASFHAQADRGPHISAFGRFEVVARNARENFEQSRPQVGTTITPAVFERLQTLTEQCLSRLHVLIEERAEQGVPCDTHGDLHLDHVYYFPEAPAPDNLVIIDCIEFNERFRFADPVADMAFLVMDLLFHGRADLAQAFSEAYFRASRDEQGPKLLAFYTAYRAAVRGKVEGMELSQKDIPATERLAALTRAQAHWLLALSQLEAPDRRPCLVLLAGLPGTGKSSLAQGLRENANFHVVRSDTVRRELAGRSNGEHEPAAFGTGIYAPEWNQRTYQECLHRARSLLLEGQRVIVDATFPEERWRRAFLDEASSLAVPAVLLHCQCNSEVARERLQNRRGDVSEADWSVYQKAAARWEQIGDPTHEKTRVIRTDEGRDEALSQALEVLRQLGSYAAGR